MAATSSEKPIRQRVPASERRDALIDAAIHEFAQSGLHGTPVDRIARKVGVAQPYVFSLFHSKRELFLAAVERCFAGTADLMRTAAAEFRAASEPEQPEVHLAMGHAYKRMLVTDRDRLMLQLQAYAACDDPVIRERVHQLYAGLVQLVAGLMPEASQEELDDFFRYGMWLNVGAAIGVDDLSAGSQWIRDEPGAVTGP